MTALFEGVEQLVAVRLGLDVASLASGAVARAARRRGAALGLSDPSAYVARLLGDRAEWDAFVDEVVVPETWLFRDGAPFEELSSALRGRATGEPGRPLRLLSLPCASGEEAWSIAFVLAEAGLSPSQATVDAVDVSPRMIAAAREGVYGPPAFRGDAATARLASFRATEKGREIPPFVRPFVRFFVGNALDFPADRPLPCYDVVFCRNLLIYLTPEARRRVTARAHSLLRPGGLLVLGSAEAFSTFFPSYVPVERRGAFAARKPVGPELASLSAPRPAPPARAARTAARAAALPRTRS